MLLLFFFLLRNSIIYSYLNADSLFDFYIYAQTCKEQPLLGLQALVEKASMEGSLLVGFQWIDINMHAYWIKFLTN